MNGTRRSVYVCKVGFLNKIFWVTLPFIELYNRVITKIVSYSQQKDIEPSIVKK